MAREVDIPPLKVGEGGIVHVFDARFSLRRDHPAYNRGYMGVRKTGNIDVFWHRWVRQPDGSYKSVLAHHGGANGFPDIEIPIRQCRRIIRGYMGVEEELEVGDDLVEASPPADLPAFSELLGRAAETIFIPGQQQFILGLKAQIDRAIREVTSRPGSLQLGGSLNILQGLSSQLARSNQPLIQQINEHILGVVLSNDRFTQFEDLIKGGQVALERLGQMDRIVVSTMHRHNRLEAHRSNSESVAVNWALEVFRQKGKLDKGENPDLVAQVVADSTRQVTAQLFTNPFKTRSEKISRILGGNINKGAAELSFWKDEIREVQRGRYNRYPLRES